MTRPDPAPARPGLVARMQRLWRDSGTQQRIVVGASVVATVLGIVGLVVPLAVALGDRTASTQTIEVDVENASSGGAGLEAGALEPVAPGLAASALGATTASRDERFAGTNYAVPVDAPWEGLWAAMSPNDCDYVTQAQVEWLETYGTLIPGNAIVAQITNTATGGGELVVSSIRPQGALTPPPVDTVTVVYYPQCIGGGDDGIFAHITLGVDPVAIYDDCYAMFDSCYTSAEAAPVPGEPVVFAVRPGETRTLTVVYDQVVDFVGRLVATVSVNGEESILDLSPGGVDIVAPHVTRPEMLLNLLDESASCTTERDIADSWIADCSLEQWLSMLADG